VPESRRAASLDLVVVGDCNPDVVVTGTDVTPVFGQRERIVDGMTLTIGGSASITAVAAARLGLRVALVAAVGDDAAGDFMLSMLGREGVDTSAVVIRPGMATGMTTVLSRSGPPGESPGGAPAGPRAGPSAGSPGGSPSRGDRAILTALGAMTTLTAADVPAGLLATARHLHVSSYFLLERPLGPGLPGLLAAARRQGLSTSLDPNDDPSGRWGGEALLEALAQADLFLPNEAEALAIGGASELGVAAGTLSRVGHGVVVKLGSRGALCVPERSSLDWAGVPGSGPAGAVLVTGPPLAPVDTTGAGDCFNAGLIVGLLGGLSLPAATALGCAVGAASTQGAGGTGARVDLDSARGQAASMTSKTWAATSPS
jgi:sugar/nucleoside kinase (ribokinase family)